MIYLDEMLGDDDDQKLINAMVRARAMQPEQVIVFGSRPYTFRQTHEMYSGMRLSGSSIAREFERHVYIAGDALFSNPKRVRDVSIQGIGFEGNGKNWFLAPTDNLASGPILEDLTIEDCGFKNFRSVMQCRILRGRIDKTYTNNCSHTEYKLAGSDNYLWLNGGFISSTRKYQWEVGSGKPAGGEPYLDFPHMSRTWVGPLYITPEGCRNAVVIRGSYGGLKFRDTLFDGTGRANNSCQYSAVYVADGEGVSLDGCTFFNVAVAKDAKAIITVEDDTTVAIRNCEFIGNGKQGSFTKAYAVSTSKPELVSNLVSTYGGNTGVVS